MSVIGPDQSRYREAVQQDYVITHFPCTELSQSIRLH